MMVPSPSPLFATSDVDLRPAIAHIIGQNPSQTDLPQPELTPLVGGISAQTLAMFSVGGKPYVYRTLSPRRDLQQRQDEVTMHSYAASLGFAPNLVYVDPEYRFMIMDYINARTLTPTDLRDPALMAKLGTMIAQIHKGPPHDFKRRQSLVDRVRKHSTRAQAKNVALPSVFPKALASFASEADFLNHEPPVTCHGDLNPGNILLSDDGPLYLIDWAGATWDSRWSDLGYFTYTHQLSDAAQAALLQGYLGRAATDHERAHLTQARNLIPFVTTCVWLDFAETPEERQKPLTPRVAQADAWLNDPKFLTGEDWMAKGEVISPLTGHPHDIHIYGLGFLKSYLRLSPSFSTH